jgi:transcriptional regulator with XRE-family HTH domain
MPRPKLKPTEEQRRMVKTMTAMGAKQEDVAARIGVRSPKTLRKYFRDELDQGASEANLAIAQTLFKVAQAGDVRAIVFWLRSRAGWRDRPDFEPSGSPPQPFIVSRE